MWTERQTAALDSAGQYSVQLGAANPADLQFTLFATGRARWLEVQSAGQNPQPRVLLANVPYALKAAGAATLGGLPVSTADALIKGAEPRTTAVLTTNETAPRMKPSCQAALFPFTLLARNPQSLQAVSVLRTPLGALCKSSAWTGNLLVRYVP